LLPKKIRVPLNLKILPDVDVAVMAIIAVPDTISPVDLATVILVDWIAKLLVKVLGLPIFGGGLNC
jgi:hypothetical protein